MKPNYKNIVFFAPTKSNDDCEAICFKHLLEFHPEIRMVDLIDAGISKCVLCNPPSIVDKAMQDAIDSLQKDNKRLHEINMLLTGELDAVLEHKLVIQQELDLWIEYKHSNK